MARVVVVTDSSACLPADLVATLGITVLPISVHLPEEPPPGVPPGWDAGAFSETTAEVELSGANHPFVTEYLAAVEEPCVDAAVIVTPAVEFAAMYRNAALAASLARRPAVAFDARTAAAGQALVVLAAARAASAGADLSSVLRALEDASRRVELVASLETLEPIRRSGPVPPEVLRAGAGVRSMFRMHHGAIEPLGEGGSADEALARIATAFKASTALGVERCVVFHAEAPTLAERLRGLLEGVDFVSGFSIAMQVHTGPGVVGAAWIPVAPRA